MTIAVRGQESETGVVTPEAGTGVDYATFLATYGSLIQTYVRRAGVIGAEAEDCCQDLVVGMWRDRAIERWDPAKASLRWWVATQVIGRMRRYWRKRARLDREVPVSWVDDVGDGDQADGERLEPGDPVGLESGVCDCEARYEALAALESVREALATRPVLHSQDYAWLLDRLVEQAVSTGRVNRSVLAAELGKRAGSPVSRQAVSRQVLRLLALPEVQALRQQLVVIVEEGAWTARDQ